MKRKFSNVRAILIHRSSWNFEDENEDEDDCESILRLAVVIHDGSGAWGNEADVRFDAEPGQKLGLDFAREFFDKPDGVVEQGVGKFI